MISYSSNILTVSANYVIPKGGVAQVVNTYSAFYRPFNHVATKKNDAKLIKLVEGAKALIEFIFILLFKNIKIVHIHGASHNSFWRKRLFISLSKKFGKKVVYHVHGAEFHLFFKQHPSVVKETVLKCNAIIALSRYWKEFFEKEIGHPNVHIVENVVLPPISKRDGNSDNACHFLFLGALGKRKGIYDLLNVIFKYKKEMEGKAIFHIGGNGEIDKVKKIIEANNLEKLVRFEGWVSGERKTELLSRADVYILPSYNEGLPISILEAMSYELPILSTPVGGIPEVVDDGVNGLLVEPGDSESLAKAILRMMADSEFRKSAGKESYKRVRPHFPDQVEDKLERVYKELLKE